MSTPAELIGRFNPVSRRFAYSDDPRSKEAGYHVPVFAVDLEAHTKAAVEMHAHHVGEFLSELYGILCDPCAEGKITVLQVRHALLEGATRARDFRERALNVARGCHDYGGGYRDAGQSETFHHGIQTVINALEAFAKNSNDTQTLALERAATAKGAAL